jgi:UDP-glucose 4-epimerase
VETIAVTGGAGFVGSNLTRRLVACGYRVKVIDDFSTGLKENLSGIRCEIIETSIIDGKAIRKALKDSDYIFHLAARGSVPRSLRNPRATIEVNTIGTLNLLECARDFGVAIANASSSSVYGSNLDLPKNEKMWAAPLTPYAASKLAAENLVHSFSHSFGVRAINYRFFNIFGPWQRADHDYAAVIPKWIWKLLNGQNRIEVYGDGSQSRDFTYIDSVIDILVEGMESKVNHPEPLNLAFGNSISLNHLIETLRKFFPKIDVQHLKPRLGDIEKSQNNPAELERVFSKRGNVNFETSIEKTIIWFKENGYRIANGPKVAD